MYKIQNDGIFGNAYLVPYIENNEKKLYECPRGHQFITATPIIIAVDDDPNYNSGPICGYCYVDWFKVNLNANENLVD